jgi:hypothetical protein
MSDEDACPATFFASRRYRRLAGDEIETFSERFHADSGSLLSDWGRKLLLFRPV